MNIRHKKLTLRQLDAVLKAFKPLKTQTIPQKGWVRAIRDALGMSARQLASRMDVKQQRIVRIEQDEKQGRVTVNTLRKVAEAMECEFVYGFVPKESLEQTVRDQARR
ncbi:MAG: mobile mystery protein A, partial [Planctomycetota bacterium]